MQTTTSTEYRIVSHATDRHRIAGEGRYQVVDGVTVWATRQAAEAALARLTAGATTATAQTVADSARTNGTDRCHYCGLPIPRGYCDECGTEPF